jgi:hypothetical protein
MGIAPVGETSLTGGDPMTLHGTGKLALSGYCAAG